MTMIGNIELLVDRLCATVSSLRSERDKLLAQCEEFKSKCAEKDLELIRLAKENQRTLELLEREQLALRKEKAQIEGQLRSLYERISAAMPELTDSLPNSREERGVST